MVRRGMDGVNFARSSAVVPEIYVQFARRHFYPLLEMSLTLHAVQTWQSCNSSVHVSVCFQDRKNASQKEFESVNRFVAKAFRELKLLVVRFKELTTKSGETVLYIHRGLAVTRIRTKVAHAPAKSISRPVCGHSPGPMHAAAALPS